VIHSHSSAAQKMVPRQSEGDRTCGLPLAKGGKPDVVMPVKTGNAQMRCYVCQVLGHQHVGSATVNFESEDVSHCQLKTTLPPSEEEIFEASIGPARMGLEYFWGTCGRSTLL